MSGIIAFRYRLLPTGKQHATLVSICEAQRSLYNAALQERIDCYRKTGKGISYMSQAMSLKTIRRDDPAGYGAMPANLLRGTLKRLDAAFSGFFSRVKRGAKPGYPRFKGRDFFKSFSFCEFSGIRFDGKRLRWKGLPGALRVHMHRPIADGKILGATFKKDGFGWFVTFMVRQPIAVPRICERHIGLDAGITTLAHLSDGTTIPNPRAARRAEKEMRRRQRALARCRRGSGNRSKARTALSACHRKIANTRSTALHQASARLVRAFDLIAIEKLNVKGLAGGILARDVNDASWATLFGMLRYKAARAGVTLVEVDPRNTSQACSGCGVIVPKPLSQREHSCPDCGLVLDRDHNAAINILHRAVLSPGERKTGGYAISARRNLKAATQ